MRIFLSHASEQHTLADRLAVALRARGDQVFLDRDDLPPAKEFHDRIRQAVEQCELFCFLISSQSIAAGRFTLSELGAARRRWPNPAAHVLPIMVEKVPVDSVPPYLRAVTILEPEGDLVAEAISRIEELRPKPWRFSNWILIASGIVAAFVLAVFLLGRGSWDPNIDGEWTGDSNRFPITFSLHTEAGQDACRTVTGTAHDVLGTGFTRVDGTYCPKEGKLTFIRSSSAEKCQDYLGYRSRGWMEDVIQGTFTVLENGCGGSKGEYSFSIHRS
jgi:TIR domain